MDGDGTGPVVYWCSRDQRVEDNWALAHALSVARRRGVPAAVAFSLVPDFADAGARQYCFMLRGLREMERKLRDVRLPFYLVQGNPGETIPALARRLNASLVVTDFSPLRMGRAWRAEVAAGVPAGVPVHEVDAHNVVPAWEASDKQEYAARTIRPKIHRRLGEFLTEFPDAAAIARAAAEIAPLRAAPPAEPSAGSGIPPTADVTDDVVADVAAASSGWTMPPPDPVDWDALIAAASAKPVPEVWSKGRRKDPGEAAALRALVGGRDSFIPNRLLLYRKRNDPNAPEALSGLSPYLHFGQLSAQRAALEAAKVRAPADSGDRGGADGGESAVPSEAVDSFLEELIVRRELADNFCMHNPHYDAVKGASEWATLSLRIHAADPREYQYTAAQLERGQTHDELWNAAQMEMVHLGSMHGFMRMYWAKKILEWTAEGPEAALAVAVALNDKYQLDGRDPNGYVGCMWAVCGVHDNAWKERNVFGKVRYMNYAGCKRKFNVPAYVARIAREVSEERIARQAVTGNASVLARGAGAGGEKETSGGDAKAEVGAGPGVGVGGERGAVGGVEGSQGTGRRFAPRAAPRRKSTRVAGEPRYRRTTRSE